MAGTPNNTLSNLATDPLRNFKFLVNIYPNDTTPWTYDGLPFKTTLGFTSVSGLAMTTESIAYREGGYNTTIHQIPGQTTFSPVTMSRGVAIGERQNWYWMRELFDVVSGGGIKKAGVDFRARIDVAVLDHPVTSYTTAFPPVKMRFRLYNAWITSLAYSDLNAGDNGLLVEQMTLVHEGFDIKWATTTTDEAAAFTF